MKVAVAGAGAAGLTAAYRIHQAGHQVTVFEALPHVGGRTRSAHFGPGHHLDTGAGWLTSAYTRTLALLDEIGERDRLQPMRASGPSELLVDGASYSGQAMPRTPGSPALVPAEETARLHEWLRSLKDYPPLGYRTERDSESASQHLATVSPGADRYIFAPMFEGLFAPLREQSAEFLRSWVSASRVTYWQVAEGMDAPWRSLATGLDVRLQSPVETLRPSATGVEVVAHGQAERFDAAVVAMPPPAAVRFIEPSLAPDWYADVRYSGQCRLYLARRGAPARAYHRRPLPMSLIASVERQSGRDGAWGACPDGWEWVLICANEAHNPELLALDDDTLIVRLWEAARAYLPDLFPLETAEVGHVVRWECAVPTMPPGHFTRMAAYDRRPPVVFAGDWTHQACVEGAVRSGEAAAAALS